MKFGKWRLWRLVAVASIFWLLWGCSSNTADSTGEAPPANGVKRSGAGTDRSRSTPARRRKTRAGLKTSSARSGIAAKRQTTLSAEDAVRRVLTIVRDSVEFAPTLVVWFFDISPSAMQWGSAIHSDVRQFYEDVAPALNVRQPDRLESAVWTISRRVDVLVKRSAKPKDVQRAIDGLRVEKSGREVTFTAVQQALKEYLPSRVKQQREVLFVIVSDEAGDDWEMVDQLVAQPRKYALPIYVIGVPAPFGRLAALDAAVEMPRPSTPGSGDSVRVGDSWQPIRQGPESRALERIALKFGGGEEVDLELMDSGFGPFGLEWLCRASGGALLAVRSRSSRDFSFGAGRRSWPSFGLMPLDPKVMRRYRPDPLDGPAYQAKLAGNRACMALHQAARLPPVEVLRDPQLAFIKKSEADLKNRLDKAQQVAAKVAPAVDKLYELLREGARDADQLTPARWRAGFDLAFGRVCAAKARIDGYNSMLAALKRGKTFTNEASTTWVLQTAETNDASSSLRKLIERAHALLRRVVDQHPGTPWAIIAKQELALPMGWQWTERP